MDNAHYLNRFKICLLCYGKTKKMFEIKNKLKDEIEKVFNYNANDERLPSAICSYCKRILYRLKSGQQLSLNITNYSEKHFKKVTRLNSKLPCDCQLCQLAKLPKCGNFAKGKILPPKKSILKSVSSCEKKGKLKEYY